MVTLTTIQSTDIIANSRADINNNFASLNAAIPTPVDNEVVSGSGTSWTLASAPRSGSIHLWGAGTRLTPGSGNDYTVSGTAITTTNSYNTGELLADYWT